MWRKVFFRGSNILKFFGPQLWKFFLFLGGHAPGVEKFHALPVPFLTTWWGAHPLGGPLAPQ